MLIVMTKGATADHVDAVVKKIESLGYGAHPVPGSARTAIGITGNDGAVQAGLFESMPEVAQVISVSQPFKLVSRECKEENSILDIGGVKVGGEDFVVMGGPCSVESAEQIDACAKTVAATGGAFLRGGAFKPRTSPYSFQGHKEEGLKLLRQAGDAHGLKVVTEVVSPSTVGLVAEYADVLQVGARNMQNFALLEEIGQQKTPVLLKRGMSATIKELLMAAEYIAKGGNYNIMLCERGIRTFETMTRNTLDLGAVTVLKELSHLPVIVDPSHGIGIRSGVTPLARAAAAVGADGLIIEMHPKPEEAMSDGAQSLTPEMWGTMMREVGKVAEAVGRKMRPL